MKTILFQGDSITDCSRVRNPDADGIQKLWNKYLTLTGRTVMGGGYPDFTAKAIEKQYPGVYQFVNRGVSGDRIPDIYARIVRDIIKIRPDYMSILVGINDVWHGIDFNNGTGIERFERVFTMLLEELKAELPEMKIMILEPFVLEGPATQSREGEPDRFIKFRQELDEVVEITKKVAEKYGAKFVPLQLAFDKAAEGCKPTDLLSDGVHPTRKGHLLIMREWLKAFNELD